MQPSATELRRLAQARWTDLLARRPDLAPAVALQRGLIGRMIDLHERLTGDAVPCPQIMPPRFLDAMASGVPAFRVERVALPVAILAPGLRDHAEMLERGGAGEPARHVVEAIDAGRVNAASWLAASFGRDEPAIRTGGIELGLSPDVLWLVGELAVAPFAARLQERCFCSSDPDFSRLAVSVAVWDRGYCPACGSWPALAEVIGGKRTLRCSFCGSAWIQRAAGCVYCAGEVSPTRGTPAAHPDPDSVESCESCQGYLKVLVRSDRAPFPLLAIDDMATVDLDVAAADAGYGRPPLPRLPGDVARAG